MARGLPPIGPGEAAAPSGDSGTGVSSPAWGALPFLAVGSALGLVVVALAFHGGRQGASWGEPLFWLGLMVMFLPAAARMCSSAADRRERIGLIVLLGLALYLVKVMQYPLGAAYHDEFGHLRSTQDIARTGELFSPNPIVPAYPFYPGLQIVTEALRRLSGLSTFSAGLVVVGAAKVMFGVALFNVLAAVARSNRVGGLAALVYMGSPSFVFFDSLFAYESLALPLAFTVLACLIAWPGNQRDALRMRVVAAILTLALVATHHLTAYALAAFLVLWAIVHYGLREHSSPRPPLLVTAIAVAGPAAWLIFVSKGATSNLVGIVADAVGGLVDLFPGGSTSEKKLFTSGTGEEDPLLEQLLGFGSVALILLALPFGLLGLWRGGRDRALPLVLGMIALAYPLSLALRLTSSGTETSSRLSAYVFLGIGLVVALAVTGYWLRRGRDSRIAKPAIFAIYAGLVFVGGIVVGLAPDSRLPGPYLVGADPRSIEPQGVGAARWSRSHLGSGRRVATDLTNSLLFASYGGQQTVRGEIAGVPVPTLFFSTRFGATERAIIEGEKLDYVVADTRLAASLPRSGDYFEGAQPEREPDAGPIPLSGFEKFDAIAGVSRVYDAGDIRVYDVRPVAEEGK